MKKNNLARKYKVDDKTIIYFLHRDQIEINIHKDALMVFLIVSDV